MYFTRFCYLAFHDFYPMFIVLFGSLLLPKDLHLQRLWCLCDSEITLSLFRNKRMNPLTYIILFRTTYWTQRLIRYSSLVASEKRKMVAAEPLLTVRGVLDMVKTNSSWTVLNRSKPFGDVVGIYAAPEPFLTVRGHGSARRLNR